MDFNIEEYKPEYKIYFEKFNKAWLDEFFTVEPIDKWVLENPEEAILKDEGYIYFVSYQGNIIGTVALKRMEAGVYEMTKMAVEKKHRGIGAGKFICSVAIQKARELKAEKLILYSQTSLAPAIAIYRKLGFREIALDDRYKRADIKMEIKLN
ncbi:MAG: GNAT family N-acetyltransferase [Sphingobacteriaceae bacterium]|nr:GNAT family N-acetyltransferase [Sphingobacteriaceae bacterium]